MRTVATLLDSLQSPVAVLFGGISEERAVSLDSGTAVMNALADMSIPFIAIDTREPWQEKLLAQGIKHALIFLHGGEGEDGRVQAVLDKLDISYAGSDAKASQLAMDKVRTKLMLAKAGIATPKGLVKNPSDDLSDVFSQLGSAVIVKPSQEGSSVGMAIAQTPDELRKAVDLAAQYDASVLIETLLNGPEYTVAILGDECLPSIMLQPDGVFYDYDAKYVSNSTRYICPADIDASKQDELNTLALKAFNVLGCKGWGRVDVMAHHNQFYVLEANTIPGMTSHSLVPKAAAAAGIDFKQLVLRILLSSLEVADD